MKTLLLSLFITFPLLIFGQDWAPVNPQWSPQFSQNGVTEIDFSIKIDSTTSDFSSLSMYYLHPTYLKCDTCQTPVSECTSQYDSLYLKQSPLLGDSIFRLEDRYTLFGPELYLKTATNLGESYAFALGGINPTVATVTAYTVIEIFGIVDSVKTFSFNDGREIVLSKNHGIISFTTESGSTQTLSGIPELKLGNYFPGIRDFYDFEVGDAFIYAGTSYVSEGSQARLFRIDITDIALFTDSIKITYTSTWKNTMWNPYPNSTSTLYSENNVQTIVFKNSSLQGIIPGMISYDVDSIKMFSANTHFEQSDPYFNSYRAIATENNNRRGLSLGGYSANFEPFYLSPFGYVNYVYISGEAVKASSLLCDEEENGNSSYLLNDSLTIHHGNIGTCEVFVEYVEGLGATFFYNECELANNQTYMIGYQKGDEEYGNILTPGEILDNREILTEANVNVFPNPARTQFIISIPDQYANSFDISLTDMTGRNVLSQSDFKSNGSLDISKLASGTYLLVGNNEEFTFARKVVVQ